MYRYSELIQALMSHIGSGRLKELEVVHWKVSMLKTSTLSRRVLLLPLPPATSMRLLQWMIHERTLFVGIGGTLGNHCFFSSSQVIVELVITPVDASTPPIRVSCPFTNVDSLQEIGEGGSVVHSAVMVSYTWTN